MILRCVRTETAPVPTARVVKFDDVSAALPTKPRRSPPKNGPKVIEARRRAVHERFAG